MMNSIIQTLRNLLFVFILSIFTSSCISTRVLTYNVDPLTPGGQVDQSNLTVENDGFSISYDVNGNCMVTNIRDSTLYLDLGESFVVFNGTAERIYSNSVITTVNSESSGTGVNLGAVAGALGVGGRIGTLANGISVSGGNLSGTSVQTFEERYVSVPPYSTVKVKFTNPSVMRPENYNKALPKKGYYTYRKGQLFTVDHILSYSFSPNQKFKQTRNSLYIKNVVGGAKGYAKNQYTDEFNTPFPKIFAVAYPVAVATILLIIL